MQGERDVVARLIAAWPMHNRGDLLYCGGDGKVWPENTRGSKSSRIDEATGKVVDIGGPYPDRETAIGAAAGLDPDDLKGPRFDLVAHLRRQIEWSARTFGPGDRTKGVLDHIRKELREIEADPSDLEEWIDLVFLAFDGAWRRGYSAEQIVGALLAKMVKNEGREWPDWRTASPDKAIEHVRPAPAEAP